MLVPQSFQFSERFIHKHLGTIYLNLIRKLCLCFAILKRNGFYEILCSCFGHVEIVLLHFYSKAKLNYNGQKHFIISLADSFFDH